MNEGQSEPGREPNVLSQDPLCAGAHLPNLDQWITPSSHFFVRNHFDIPNVDLRHSIPTPLLAPASDRESSH